MKRKYLAQWVQVTGSDSQDEGKAGVVMDEECLYNNKIYCRVIVKNEVILVEAKHLKKIHV